MAAKSQQQSALATGFAGNELAVVLYGPDLFLRGELMVRLRRALEQKSGAEAEPVHFDGTRATVAEVLDELRSFGLMQQHRLVVVNDADKFVSEHRDALARYLESPVESATLLLRAEKWNKGNLDKLIEKTGRIVKCEAPSRGEAEGWLAARAVEGYKVKIDRGALSLMVDHIGLDLGRLDTELGKLAVGVEPGGLVKIEHVQSLVGFASDEEVWAIQEALLGGDGRRMLELVNELMFLARVDPTPVAWAVADLMRKLHHAAVLAASGENAFSIAGKLKIWPRERVDPFLRVARKLGAHGAARLLDEALILDRRTKSGFGEGPRNLELFCVRFAEAVR